MNHTVFGAPVSPNDSFETSCNTSSAQYYFRTAALFLVGAWDVHIESFPYKAAPEAAQTPPRHPLALSCVFIPALRLSALLKAHVKT